MIAFFGPSKTTLRKRMQRVREEAARAEPDAAQRLTRHYPPGAWPAIGEVVAGYFPFREEIDPVPLLSLFACEGAVTALPAAEPDRSLTFRAWRPGDPLTRGLYGIEVPSPEADIVTPDILLVPLLAFDDKGRRLGYGAGFYDRALARLRAERPVQAIGLGYEAQRVKRVPTEAHDATLNWALTERAAYEFE